MQVAYGEADQPGGIVGKVAGIEDNGEDIFGELTCRKELTERNGDFGR